jgi:inner membrane protein
MEPVTHVLTGACLARSGLNRKAAYATLAMAIAAEFPDIDTVWGFRGPIQDFQHHRGITHTFLGLPFEAAIVVLAIYGFHRWRVARQRRRTSGLDTKTAQNLAVAPITRAPVRWGMLYLLCLVALLSHLLLDYTNNYGLRPFFPFNPHWYAASIVFIFDPLIFALLLFGLIGPSIFRLVSAEIGAQRQPFAARGWSAAALIFIVLLWCVRWVEHDRAVQLAMAQSLEAPGPLPSDDNPNESPSDASHPSEVPAPVYLAAKRALASPDPLSIFRWYTVTDFGPIYQLERADTRDQTLVATEGTFAKPDRGPAILAAEASYLGRVYLDWSSMPILTVDNTAAAVQQAVAGTEISPPEGGSVVTLRDPRFMGVLPWRSGDSSSPLSGTVVLDHRFHVVLETLDGRSEPTK